jgi:hypothetical protein
MENKLCCFACMLFQTSSYGRLWHVSHVSNVTCNMLVTVSTYDDLPLLIKVIAWPCLFELLGAFGLLAFGMSKSQMPPKARS